MNVLVKENEVLNDLLGYEGLKIIQEPGRFNFSLDSTLLAHFVSIPKGTKRIFDFCTGNAPIPLMLTLRTDAAIIANDIQADSVDQARRSVLVNKLEKQITIYHEDVNLLHDLFPPGYADVITCNPPYFKVNPDSNLNKNDALSIARHEVLLTLDDVIREAAYLLKPDGGRFAMVHRPDRLAEIFELFKVWGIEPKRLRFIYPRLNKEANGVLIEGVLRGKTGGLRLEPPLIVYDGETNNYTQEILAIFNMKKKEVD